MSDDENRLIGHDSADDEVIHGLLEVVDLKSAAFRLVDAVGNAVDLAAVRNPTEARALVGLPVTATGPLLRAAGAKHDRLEGPSVTAMRSLHERLAIPAQPTLDALIAGARRSPEPSGIDLTDDELDVFLAVIHG